MQKQITGVEASEVMATRSTCGGTTRCPREQSPAGPRHLRETRREQVEGPADGAGHHPTPPMPEVLGAALEAEQRVVRRSATLDRVVTRFRGGNCHRQRGRSNRHRRSTAWPCVRGRHSRKEARHARRAVVGAVRSVACSKNRRSVDGFGIGAT